MNQPKQALRSARGVPSFNSVLTACLGKRPEYAHHGFELAFTDLNAEANLAALLIEFQRIDERRGGRHGEEDVPLERRDERVDRFFGALSVGARAIAHEAADVDP